MPLETATHVNQLVATNPAHSDGLNQADSHLRLIKSVLLTDVASSLTSGNLTTPDGTVSAPSHGFAADATTGFYRKGTGETGIAGRLVGQGAVPIGAIIDYAAGTAPAGYLACDGTAVSRTTYAELFAAISTTWGAGDGSTTFNVPNLQSRYTRHRDGGTYAGAVGTLQNPQNLSHTHTYSGTTSAVSNDHSHAFNVNSGTESANHNHNFSWSGETGGMDSNNPHSHSVSPQAGTFVSASAGGALIGGLLSSTGIYSSSASVGATDINHGHPYSGSSTTGVENQSHYHNVAGNTGGISANHTHTFSGTTSGGSADGSEARPYSATVLKCIRAL